MIQIRNNVFETNSSSCHVFGFKPDENISIPSTVELKPNSDESILQIIFNDYYEWYSPGSYGEKYIIDFIDMLYTVGVKTIICSDKNISKLAEYRKNLDINVYNLNRNLSINEFKHICFGENTKITTMEDYDIYDEKIKEKFGEGYKYCAYRLS